MTVWPYPRLIAHRCGGSAAPENTLAGLRIAARHRFRAAEFDVMLSADGTAFLMHDETLERTTDGHGRLADARDRDVRRLDAGGRFGAAFAGEPVPSLDDAIRLCLELGLWANIEIKPARGHDGRTAEAVARAVALHWRGEPPLLSSFSVEALAAARESAPQLPRALLVGSLAQGWREQAARLGCVSIHADATRLGPGDVSTVHRAGLWLACYTVDDPVVCRRLVGAGVDAVFTDRLEPEADADAPAG